MYKLRELQRQDLLAINNWRNTPALIELLGAPFRFINMEVEESWFENYMRNRNTCIRCAIVEDGLDNILGLVSLTNMNAIHRTAEFHIMIGDSCNFGKGIGTFAATTMIKHAFENMNIRRIELNVLRDNERARKLYEKVGFKKEGIREKAVYKSGEYKDLVMYALLKQEG